MKKNTMPALWRSAIVLGLSLLTAFALLLFAPAAGFSSIAAEDDDDDDIWGAVITYDDITMERGKSQNVNCSVYTNADSYVLYWYSSNENVAKVQAVDFTDHATVYAMNDGTATINVTLRAGGMTLDNDSFKVTVKGGKAAVTGVGLNTLHISLGAGQTNQLQAYVYPSNATNKNLLWGADDTSIATVDSNGKVTGVRNGSTIVTVRSQENPSIHESCRVDVIGTVVKTSAIGLSQNILNLNAGTATKLLYTIYPSNASNKNVVWSTSSEWIAPVYQDGTVLAYRQGSAVITARTADGGAAATCVVNVTGNASYVPSPSVPSPVAPAAPAAGGSTRDATFNYNTCVAILTAPAGGTAAVGSDRPLSFDANVANALKARPDVTLVANFPFNGHTFNLILPKGYDLGAKLDPTGYVDFLVLCNYQNLPGEVQVVMLK